MSKILNDSELQEIRELSVYTHGEEWAFVTDLEGYVPALLDHIDAMTAALDAEAAAHSVTRAALVASPEWVAQVYGVGNNMVSAHICPHCKNVAPGEPPYVAQALERNIGHATDCLRQVALFGENWQEELNAESMAIECANMELARMEDTNREQAP